MTKRNEDLTCGVIALAFCAFVFLLSAGVAMIVVGSIYLSQNAGVISLEGCYALIGVGIACLIASACTCMFALFTGMFCVLDSITW